MGWSCKNCGGDMKKATHWMEIHHDDEGVFDPGQPIWECKCCGYQTPRKARRVNKTTAEREAFLQELLKG